MNFLQFLEEKKNSINQTKSINEAFKVSEIDKVHDLMVEIFRKKISNKVCKWDWLDTTIDEKPMRSFYFINLQGTPLVWSLNYLVDSKSSEVYSISFYDEAASHEFLWGDETKFKSALEISTLGTSVACFIPIICHVVKHKAFNLHQGTAEALAQDIFNEGKKNEYYTYMYGALQYTIFENLSEQDIEDMFYLANGYTKEKYFNEATEAQDYRWRKKQERDDAYRRMRETGSSSDRDAFNRINDEYREIVSIVRGGAKTIEDVKMALSRGKEVIVDRDDAEEEQELKSPKQAFKEMQVYIKTVMKGLQPGVILCGAPGIGKTYKVLQQLKAAGYEDGKNLDIIKGKCTPRHLYLSLFNFSNKGQIILIDDADALVGPKAPEDCINMLKAALDSTATDEGRKISYRVSGQIWDDEGREVPKTCYYNGGVIVITNYSVGQLDSALRGRTFVQSLDFTNKQILELIEDLLPNLGKGQLSEKSKRKALEYLNELADEGAEMEISIRTFNTCARLFAVCEDELDMSDDDVKSMIPEQTKNQSLQGGKKV
jgi:hypothetical protein